MVKANPALRDLLYKERIPFWKIAEKLGVHESTVIRWFRTELDKEHRIEVMSAIAEVKNERGE